MTGQATPAWRLRRHKAPLVWSSGFVWWFSQLPWKPACTAWWCHQSAALGACTVCWGHSNAWCGWVHTQLLVHQDILMAHKSLLPPLALQLCLATQTCSQERSHWLHLAHLFHLQLQKGPIQLDLPRTCPAGQKAANSSNFLMVARFGEEGWRSSMP